MKYLNRLLIFLFIVIGVWYVLDKISRGTTDRLLIALAIIPVVMGPFLIHKILHYKMSETLKFIYYVFAFCGLILGSIFNLYNIPEAKGFDKFTHFISGVLTSVTSLIVLKRSGSKREKLWFVLSYIIVFSIAIGGIWELFEFFCDRITGGNAQHAIETGVADTMGDMIAATSASILFALYYYYQEKYAKDNKIEKLKKHL